MVITDLFIVLRNFLQRPLHLKKCIYDNSDGFKCSKASKTQISRKTVLNFESQCIEKLALKEKKTDDRRYHIGIGEIFNRDAGLLASRCLCRY